MSNLCHLGEQSDLKSIGNTQSVYPSPTPTLTLKPLKVSHSKSSILNLLNPIQSKLIPLYTQIDELMNNNPYFVPSNHKEYRTHQQNESSVHSTQHSRSSSFTNDQSSNRTTPQFSTLYVQSNINSMRKHPYIHPKINQSRNSHLTHSRTQSDSSELQMMHTLSHSDYLLPHKKSHTHSQSSQSRMIHKLSHSDFLPHKKLDTHTQSGSQRQVVTPSDSVTEKKFINFPKTISFNYTAKNSNANHSKSKSAHTFSKGATSFDSTLQHSQSSHSSEEKDVPTLQSITSHLRLIKPNTFQNNPITNKSSKESKPNQFQQDITPSKPKQFQQDIIPSKQLFYCDFEGCTKGFTRKYNLVSHLRVHYGKHTLYSSSLCILCKGERPFECSVCSVTFSRKHDLSMLACLSIMNYLF